MRVEIDTDAEKARVERIGRSIGLPFRFHGRLYQPGDIIPATEWRKYLATLSAAKGSSNTKSEPIGLLDEDRSYTKQVILLQPDSDFGRVA